MEDIINLDSDNESASSKVQDKVLIDKLYSITIKQSDYNRLDPGMFLNDNLIDFFLRHLIHKKDDFFAFNSFFYPTLTENGFEGVHKWFKSVNLFTFRYWIIPVARNEHWVLIIVTNPKNAATGKKPAAKILFFDSLDSRFFDPQCEIEKFINFEWKEKFHTEVFVELPIFFLNVPLQNNSFDCGVFLLKYAEEFVKNPELFKNPDQGFQELFRAKDLFDQRNYLKSTIMDIRDGEVHDWIADTVIIFLKNNDQMRHALRD